MIECHPDSVESLRAIWYAASLNIYNLLMEALRGDPMFAVTFTALVKADFDRYYAVDMTTPPSAH